MGDDQRVVGYRGYDCIKRHIHLETLAGSKVLLDGDK